MVDYRIHAEFVPNLRVSIVTDNGRRIEGPWIGPTMVEWADQMGIDLLSPESLKREWLTKKQTRSFWEYVGRTDRVPRHIKFEFYAEDVKRIWPAKSDNE